MTISPTKHIRETILTALKADAATVALVPRLYPTKTPNAAQRPFGRYGTSDGLPERAAGWSGASVSSIYHVFVGRTDSVPDPESYCSDAVDAVADVIDSLAGCFVDRTQVIPDTAEPDAHHGLVYFTYTALTEL